ncbi:unnamed protein product, partial [Brassica rapa subsp. narinosa]
TTPSSSPSPPPIIPTFPPPSSPSTPSVLHLSPPTLSTPGSSPPLPKPSPPAPTTLGSPTAPITPPRSPTLNPPSSSGPPSNPSSGGSGGPSRTPSSPSPPCRLLLPMDYQLVRRNEEETKKMFTMFLLHLLLFNVLSIFNISDFEICNVLAFLSRRTIRWTTATMAATKRNTTVRSCRDVTITAIHHIRFYIGTGRDF